MNHFDHERTDATILRGVDWARVRAELKVCREAAKLSQVGLARKMLALGAPRGRKGKTNKSTVNRIENVYGEPDHVPDLDTIERWVLATGVNLSDFFRRVEGLPAGAERAHKGTTPNTTPAPGGRDDEDRTVSADRSALDDLRAFIVRLGDVLADAAATTHPDNRPLPGARPRKTKSR